MSSDNGYIIRKHPNGGFCPVDYCMSILMEDGYKTPDGYPYPSGREEQFDTIQSALDACESNDFMDRYYSEYGAHLDNECRRIQRELRNELHLEVSNKDTVAGNTCSCGQFCSSLDQLYKHQAENLREQLKQLR
jgi:hypothetical protein